MHGSNHNNHELNIHLQGHNSKHAETVQWQVPHTHHDHDHDHDENDIGDEKRDLDLVEKAFVESFHDCSDPTSFLRMVNIPLTGTNKEGNQLHLLRVELQNTVDIGSLTPHLGGKSFNYSPLPARMVSKRDTLLFVYQTAGEIIKLSMEEAKALKQEPDK